MRAPLLLIAVPLLAGAATGLALYDHAPEYLVLATAGAGVMCVVAAVGFLTEDWAAGVVVSTVFGATFAGYSSAASIATALYAPSLLVWYEGQTEEGPIVVEGVLRDDAAVVDGGPLLSVDVDKVCDTAGRCTSVEGGVRLAVGGTVAPEILAHWRAGRRIRLPAVLRVPLSFSNPGVPDDVRVQARRGVVLTGSVKSAALVEVLAEGTAVQERAAGVRSRVREVLTRHVGQVNARSGAVAIAILIGDRTGLSAADEQRLQDAGTYHVIAISGGNVAIFAATLLGLARLFRAPYRVAAGATILLLLAYGEIAGGTASVERAVTAAVILLAALILDHRGSPLNVLAGAAVLAVSVVPASVFDPGFLLSFGATAGILLGVPALTVRAPGSSRGRLVGSAVRAGVAVLGATVCAEAALLPIAATVFSRVTLAGLVLNFAAVPLMAVVQCGSMVLLALVVVAPHPASAVAYLVHRAADGLVESSRAVGLAPWLVRDVMPPAWWLVVTYYALALLMLVGWRRRPWTIVLFGGLAGLVFLGPPGVSRRFVDPVPAGTLRLVVLDVGQGDASVALLPNGGALLVDTGGLAGTTFDIGGRVVLPALRALGVRALHGLVLTHGDPDHIGGAETIIGRLRPGAVWNGVPVPPHAPTRALIGAAEAHQIPCRTVTPGSVDHLGGVDIVVHHPPVPDWERQRVRNDDSVVVELRYHDVSILLPGDVGREVEASLVSRFETGRTVILKAAHHGSATSSSDPFIDALAPRAVIFSAGRNNRFGHPAKAVVERFARRRIPMFNTADDGAVFVDTDGHSVVVHTWKTGRRVITNGTKEAAE